MRHSPRTCVAALAVSAFVCAAVLRSDDWEPLAGWIGWIAILLSRIGLGLTMGWWAILAAPIAFALAAVVVRPGGEGYDTFSLLFIMVPASALVASLASLAGLWVRRPEPAAAVLAGAAVLVAIGLVRNARVVDHDPESPIAVELSTGALPGVRPGSSASRLRERFGRETVTKDLSEMAPLGEDSRDLSGPSSFSSDFVVHRFRHLAVFVRGGKIVGYVTTDPDVVLGEGVGIGDSIELVKDRGLPLPCYGVSLGSDSTRPAYPNCVKRVPGGARLGAGGDPIDSIWVVR